MEEKKECSSNNNENEDKEREEYKNFEEKIKKFQCPFTWEMDEINENLNTDYKPHDEEDLIPILKLFRLIMTNFVKIKIGKNLDSIANDLKEVDETLRFIKSERSDTPYCVRTVNLVVNATKCFIYLKLKNFKELKKIIQNIPEIDKNDKKFINTINMCKSICWSVYHTKSQKAKEFSEKAIKDNPDCDISYFILGRSLRRIRRDAAVESCPSVEEIVAFKKAFDIGKNNIVFCLFIAQTLRESKNFEEAIKLYEIVLKLISKANDCSTVYLRTALGFLNCQYKSKREERLHFDLAKECLDKVDKKYSKDSMFLHYNGIYYLKIRNYEEAAKYFKEATLLDNMGAAIQYIKCMFKINKNFDHLNFLLEFEKNRENLEDKRNVNLYLHIAFSYLEYKNNEKALNYFLKAIKFDSKSIALRKYYGILKKGPQKPENIYKIVDEILKSLPESKTSNDELKNVIFELKNYCLNAALSNLKV